MDITFYHRRFKVLDEGETEEVSLDEQTYHGDINEVVVWIIGEGCTESSDGTTYTDPNGSHTVDYRDGIELEVTCLIGNADDNELLTIEALIAHYEKTGRKPSL